MSIGWHARSEWPARRSRMLVTDPTSGTARGQPYAAALMNSHERPRYAEHELERGMRRPPGEDRVSNLLATNPLLVTRNAMWRDENRTRRQPSPKIRAAGLAAVWILLCPSVARSQPNRPLTQAGGEPSEAASTSIDQTFVAFGPRTFRQGGTTGRWTASFQVRNPNAPYTLKVTNGSPNGTARVSYGLIRLNGQVVLVLQGGTPAVQKSVSLGYENQLSIETRGSPGATLVVIVSGIDADPPSIRGVVSPPPNAAGWNSGNVQVSFICSDATTSVKSCPGAVSLNNEGANQIVRGTAVDAVGNTASATVTVNIDKTAPVIQAVPDPPPNQAGWNNTNVTVRFIASDGLSGIASVTPDAFVTTEGAGQIVNGTAVDRAGNSAAASVVLRIDKTAPTIVAAPEPPPNRAGWNNSDVTVCFSATDGLSGIAAVAPCAALQQEGAGQVVAGDAVDLAGNSSAAEISVSIDKTLPALTIASPLDQSTVNTDQPLFDVRYQDSLSGIDESAPMLALDGADITARFTRGPDAATYQPSSSDALADGPHGFTATIADRAGNPAGGRSDFNVQTRRLRALPQASPTSGNAPLAVTFREAGDDPTSTIALYAWDFQGDGIYDTCRSGVGVWHQVATYCTYTYAAAGTYNATLTVQNQRGEQASASVTIMVSSSAPVVSAEASPSNGAVPLTVQFVGTATDPDGRIVKYEWDFDGDGVFDFMSPSSGTTSHVYDTAGTYRAVFRATDSDGLFAEAPAVLTEVRIGPSGSPTARASANPTRGATPLTVSFSSSGSSDPDGTIVLVEWDFDGDGSYDASFPSPGTVSHRYDLPGRYFVALRVTDNDGLTGVDYILIEATVTVALSIGDADYTFNPSLGQTMPIDTTISSPATVWLEIRDGSGNVAATPVNGVARPAGTTRDNWSGTDDSGTLLPDGIYYAVLRYRIGANDYLLDLTQSTGGVEYRPTRSSTGGTPSNPVLAAPFSDSLLPINYTLPRASETTLFVGVLWTTNARVRTILNREPMPAGAHTTYWDGLTDEGNIAYPPPGTTSSGFVGLLASEQCHVLDRKSSRRFQHRGRAQLLQPIQ